MVILYVFTGETGSLFEKPGLYGAPGHAVVLHMSGDRKIQNTIETRSKIFPAKNVAKISLGIYFG